MDWVLGMADLNIFMILTINREPYVLNEAWKLIVNGAVPKISLCILQYLEILLGLGNWVLALCFC